MQFGLEWKVCDFGIENDAGNWNIKIVTNLRFTCMYLIGTFTFYYHKLRLISVIWISRFSQDF